MIAWHFTSGNKLRDGQPLPPRGEWLHHTLAAMQEQGFDPAEVLE